MYALKLELKLNNKERSLLAGCAGFSRFVYNFGLSLLTQSWSFEDVKAGDAKRLAAIEKVFTQYVKTKTEYAWMQQYPSAIYSSAFRNLASSLKNWREGRANIPRFKSKKCGDSFTVLKKAGVYSQKGKPALPFTNRQVLSTGSRITIPGNGKFRLKQPIPYICASQTFTISKTAKRWFVSFMIDATNVPLIIHEVESVGIDLGVKCFATLSDGSKIEAPQQLKEAKIKLSKMQWRNRNKQLGNRRLGVETSFNARDYFKQLAEEHAHIANVRQDYIQKTTTAISQKYYRIWIEDLNISGMIANHKLSEAIASLGLYEFRRQLTYKERFYGTLVEVVDRWYPSSKTCWCCGHIQPMPLSERIYNCEKCGHVQDRDMNAALNLKHAPNERVRRATSELTPVDQEGAVTPGRSRKQTLKRAG